MPLVASDEVIGLRRLAALQEFRVIRVDRDGRRRLWHDELALTAKHREQRRDLLRRKRKFGAREHARIYSSRISSENQGRTSRISASLPAGERRVETTTLVSITARIT
jgi:hypothetical protein